MKLCKGRKEFLTVLFLFGLVLFIRVVYIPAGRVWYDEIVSMIAAKQSISEIYELASVETNTPTYYMLLHYYVQLFGDGEVTLRLLSVFFGLLSSLTMFLLAKELTKDKLVPKIVLFLVAISPFHLYYSHEIRVYSLLIFVSSLTLLSLIKCLHGKDPKVFWEVCYALSVVLGAYLHITYLFYLLALDIFLLVKGLRERRRDLLVRNLLLPNLFLFGSIVVFYVVGHPIVIEQIANISKVRLSAGKNPMYGTSVEDFLSTVVRVYWGEVLSPSILMTTVALFYLGFKKLRAEGRCALLFLMISATSLFIPPRLPSGERYMAYAFPAAVTLMALGLHRLWRALKEFGGKSFKLNKVLVVCAFVTATTLSVQISMNSRSSRHSCLASFFEEKRRPEALVLVMPAWDQHVLHRYLAGPLTVRGVHTGLDRFGRGLPLAEVLSANWQPVVDEQTVGNLENYIRGFGDVWYVNFDKSSDPENLALKWLVENTNLEKIYYVNCSEIRDDPPTKMPVFLFRNEGL